MKEINTKVDDSAVKKAPKARQSRKKNKSLSESEKAIILKEKKNQQDRKFRELKKNEEENLRSYLEALSEKYTQIQKLIIKDGSGLNDITKELETKYGLTCEDESKSDIERFKNAFEKVFIEIDKNLK